MTLTLERESEKDLTKKHAHHVELGLERLLEEGHAAIRGARVGLICNQASVDHSFTTRRISCTTTKTFNCERCLVRNTEFAATSRTT